MNERSCQAANAFLEMGIRRGDRVVFITHNCLEYIYCRYGLSKIGAIMVPINFMLKGDAIAYILNDCQPKAIFVEDVLVDVVRSAGAALQKIEHFGWFGLGGKSACPDGWRDAATLFGGAYSSEEPRVIVESDDIATIMYTTGTESFPKGVMSTNLNYFMSLLLFACDCDFRREDVLIIDIPLFHIAGSVILTAALAIGSRCLIEYAPDPINILRKTEEERVTYWIYPATLYLALPSVPGLTATTCRRSKCVSFGSVIQGALERWQGIKPDLQWRDYWGQTEHAGGNDVAARGSGLDHGIHRDRGPGSVKVFDPDDREVPPGSGRTGHPGSWS